MDPGLVSGYTLVMDAPAPDESLAQSREDSLGRLKAFTDGTVAIALTLLVLPLVEVAGQAGNRSVVELFLDDWGTFVAFFLSFLVIARLWTIHRRSFSVLRDFDNGVATRLTVWLLTIVFLPFPTDLLFSGTSLRNGAATLYLFNLLAAGLANMWQGAYLRRHPEWLHRFVTPAMSREARRQGVFAVSVLALCTLVSVLSPVAGLYGLFLLALVDRVRLPFLRPAADAQPLPD